MGLFDVYPPNVNNATFLDILKAINNTFYEVGEGIQFSNYKSVSDPSKTVQGNDNVTRGPIAYSRYSGSKLFDTFYGMYNDDSGNGSTNYGYSWKTEILSTVDDKYYTQHCRLIFGIIPIIWSDGDEFNINHYGPGSTYFNSSLETIVRTFLNERDDVAVFQKQVNYFKIINYQSQLLDNEQTGESTDSLGNLTFEFLTIHNAIGLGINTEYSHNYKSCDFSLKDYKIINARKNSEYKWWDTEHDGIKGYSWLPAKNSLMPRIGAIPAKVNNSISFIPAFGYYKCRNTGYGISDTSFTTWTDPRTGFVHKENWNTICTQIQDATSDDIFGSVRSYYNDKNYITFNTILSYMYNELRLAGSIDNPTGHDFMTADYRSTKNCQFYDFTYNMLEYDTIKYDTDLLPYGSSIHFVPVFALNTKQAQMSPCGIINLFQSIIYNTYNNEEITIHSFGQNHKDINAIPYNERKNRVNTNQASNTNQNYTNENFIMKFDESTNSIYISYAIDILGGVIGNPIGIRTGRTMVNINDGKWIAWINGNIYVIPKNVFNKFVYCTSADFDLLNNIMNYINQ